jgi:predicted DNA-binding protein
LIEKGIPLIGRLKRRYPLMGRGRKKEHTERVFSRVSPQVRERLKRFASKHAITESEAIRFAIEKLLLSEKELECQTEKVEALRDIADQLRRIGINLNQIARYVNFKKEIETDIAEQIGELAVAINEVLSLVVFELQKEQKYAFPKNGN